MHAAHDSGDGGPAAAAAVAAASGAPSFSPGVSSVEVYGFVGWITSSVAYVLYMLWAYTPSWLLEAHGVTYYPNQYWAVALPAWVCVTVVFVYWLYESLCMMSAPPPGAASSMEDKYSKRKEDVGLASYFSGAEERIPPLVDVPQELVSLMLYGGVPPREAEQLFDKRQRRRAVAPGIATELG